MPAGSSIEGGDGGGSAARHIVLEIVLDVLIYAVTALTLWYLGCVSTAGCPYSGLVVATKVLFLLVNIILIGGFHYLVSQARLVEDDADEEYLQSRFRMSLGKFAANIVMHLTFGVMFPLISGVIISVVSLPLWTDYDHSYLKKYWKGMAAWSCAGLVPHQQCRRMEVISDLGVLLLVAAIAVSCHCEEVQNCSIPDLTSWLPIVTMSLTACVLGVQLYLLYKMHAVGTEDAKTDAGKVRFNIFKLIAKTGVYYALYAFVGMIAPLVAIPLVAVMTAPVFSDYDRSLWHKYADTEKLQEKS